jgi:hypothetical protein
LAPVKYVLEVILLTSRRTDIRKLVVCVERLLTIETDLPERRQSE